MIATMFYFTFQEVSSMSEKKNKILVADDEKEIRDILKLLLSSEGYEVTLACDGQEVLDLADDSFDMFILDVNMPKISGFSAGAKLREKYFVPMIFLTAYAGESDKAMGFAAGADDYLTKPFSVEELLARLRVTQRRLLLLQASGDADSPVFQNGKLKIDYAAGCAYLNGEELHLTPIEYKLLCLLSHNVGKVLTHTYITQQIWGSSWENDIASLRVFMATLRKKLEPQKDSPQYIQTHIGVGYRMLRVD